MNIIIDIETILGPARPAPEDALGRLQLAGRHLAAALIALEFVAELLALLQRAEARAFNGRDVHEHIGAAVVGLDEAVAFLAVEPLDGAALHMKSLSGHAFSRSGRRMRSNFRRGSLRIQLRRDGQSVEFLASQNDI